MFIKNPSLLNFHSVFSVLFCPVKRHVNARTQSIYRIVHPGLRYTQTYRLRPDPRKAGI